MTAAVNGLPILIIMDDCDMTALQHRFFMAPMAEITTPAFRRAVRNFSVDAVLSTEMLSAAALAGGGMHNAPMSAKHPFDDPIIYQIAGNDPAVMKEACARLSEKLPFSIDINMGCAAPDILKKGYGAALLKNTDLAKRIVTACREAAGTLLSVKMRGGFHQIDIGYLTDFVRMLRDCGVDFVTIHPRSAKMGFRRKADWSVLRKVREAANIPVIGNGDIADAGTAVRNLEEFGCDGVMIGRNAVRSPWIFALCENYRAGWGKKLEINVHSVFNAVLEGIRTMLPRELHRSRGHRFCFYFSKNAVYGHDLFTKIRKESTVEAMMAIVDDYYERNEREKMLYFNTGTGGL